VRGAAVRTRLSCGLLVCRRTQLELKAGAAGAAAHVAVCACDAQMSCCSRAHQWPQCQPSVLAVFPHRNSRQHPSRQSGLHSRLRYWRLLLRSLPVRCLKKPIVTSVTTDICLDRQQPVARARLESPESPVLLLRGWRVLRVLLSSSEAETDVRISALLSACTLLRHRRPIDISTCQDSPPV